MIGRLLQDFGSKRTGAMLGALCLFAAGCGDEGSVAAAPGRLPPVEEPAPPAEPTEVVTEVLCDMEDIVPGAWFVFAELEVDLYDDAAMVEREPWVFLCRYASIPVLPPTCVRTFDFSIFNSTMRVLCGTYTVGGPAPADFVRVEQRTIVPEPAPEPAPE